MWKKKIIILIIPSIILGLTGCTMVETILEAFHGDEKCPDNLLESPFIMALIDGDDEWMGIRVGVTKTEMVVETLSAYDIPIDVRGSVRSEEISESQLPEFYDEQRGVIKVTIREFCDKDFWIVWDTGVIVSIGFRWDDCVTVESLMEKIDSTPYLVAIVTGLHETKLVANLIYPDYGLVVGIESWDIENPVLKPESTITFLTLYPPIDSFKKTNDLGGLIDDYDAACARDWQGYGNVMTLYYPDADGTRCPYDIP